MEDTIEGAFINELRDHQDFAVVTDVNVQDLIDRAKRLKKKNPQLSYDHIIGFMRHSQLKQRNDHDLWTGECNDEAANGLVLALNKIADKLDVFAHILRT